MQEILTLRGKKSVLLNEFTFREEVMQRIYQKEKSRAINPPAVLNAIDQDTDNTVFFFYITARNLILWFEEAHFLKSKKK
jgi:hypothetical protein